MPPSQLSLPLLPDDIHKSVLYIRISIPALQISTIFPGFQIYGNALIYDICFFFLFVACFTLYTASRFNHLTLERTLCNGAGHITAPEAS